MSCGWPSDIICKHLMFHTVLAVFVWDMASFSNRLFPHSFTNTTCWCFDKGILGETQSFHFQLFAPFEIHGSESMHMVPDTLYAFSTQISHVKQTTDTVTNNTVQIVHISVRNCLLLQVRFSSTCNIVLVIISLTFCLLLSEFRSPSDKTVPLHSVARSWCTRL